MGTKFIATTEARSSEEYRQALLTSSMDDVTLGIAPNGIAASSLRTGPGSAGHSVSGVHGITSAAELVETTQREWDAAIRDTSALAAKLLG